MNSGLAMHILHVHVSIQVTVQVYFWDPLGYPWVSAFLLWPNSFWGAVSIHGGHHDQRPQLAASGWTPIIMASMQRKTIENRENIDVLPVISLSRKLFGKRGKPLEAPFLFRSSSWSTPADLTHRLPSLVRGDPGIFICLRLHHVGPGCGYTDLRYYVFLGM